MRQGQSLQVNEIPQLEDRNLRGATGKQKRKGKCEFLYIQVLLS